MLHDGDTHLSLQGLPMKDGQGDNVPPPLLALGAHLKKMFYLNSQVFLGSASPGVSGLSMAVW